MIGQELEQYEKDEIRATMLIFNNKYIKAFVACQIYLWNIKITDKQTMDKIKAVDNFLLEEDGIDFERDILSINK